MNKNILIVGKGFIGSRLKEALDCAVSTEKIYAYKDAERQIDRFKPKVLINCIGFTGANVDECELHKDKTLTANTFVPILLADVCVRRKIKLVHISSGCIYHYKYGKDRPIGEEKLPDFFDLFYSRTKIYTERALEILSGRYGVLIVRTRIPLDNRPHPKNLLTKLIHYKKIIDIPNSISYIPDFIQAVKYLVKIDAQGIYNVVNKGGLRYKDLLSVYKKYVPDFSFETIDYKKLKMVRTNLVLTTRKLEQSGFNVRPVKEVLEECVRNYLKY